MSINRRFARTVAAMVAIGVQAAAWGAAAEIAPPPHSSLSDDAVATLVSVFEERFARDPEYDPRTTHVDEDGRPLFVNRLIESASPYLRQHAHNPVDWRPWGPEALAEAEALGRPIFLSVGYATCHWCHVMEEESFDTLAVAEMLNRDFIPIKVDREELPDVDETYMIATMMMQGRGGWPNSLWLTPDGAPFFAGTYFPQADFLQISESIALSWRFERESLEAAGGAMAERLQAFSAHQESAVELEYATREAAVDEIAELFDPLSGGFGQGPRFPQEVYLSFLLDHWRRTGSEEAFAIVRTTLDAIVAGGVHDHVGGGFHRYTVDPAWRVPHFEKMLYSQGQIVTVLVEAWTATADTAYRRAAERAIDYALRDLRSSDGAFYAAEDADSIDLESGRREEGAFYAFTAEEAGEILGDVEHPAIQTFSLYWPPAVEAGSVLSADIADLGDLGAFDDALEALRLARDGRPRPLRDEKIIAGWNGLMIRALAEAGVAFERPDYLDAARDAALAVWLALWDDDAQRLGRLYTADGVAPLDGRLEDYAFLGLGMLALWEATGEPAWLGAAHALADQVEPRFADERGRLRMAEEPGPLGPVFEQTDGATPAGESAALELFARLPPPEGVFVEGDDRTERLLTALSGAIARWPSDRLTALEAAIALREGDSDGQRTLLSGIVRIALRVGEDQATILLSIADGWHVNADRPIQDYLAPTALTGAALDAVAFPPHHEIELGFAGEIVRVFEGEVEIAIDLAQDRSQWETTGRLIDLTFQVCNDEQCLAPQTESFRIGAAVLN